MQNCLKYKNQQKSPPIEHWMENNQLVVEDKPFCKKTKKSMASFSSDVLISVFRKKGDIPYDIKKTVKVWSICINLKRTGSQLGKRSTELIDSRREEQTGIKTWS